MNESIIIDTQIDTNAFIHELSVLCSRALRMSEGPYVNVI